ncbi:MAG: bifunctional tetrahydrofolate synthase/dihydrofolate synthase [Legionellales bacterium]|nr:bifunctional tetrahydrofolate synthase/dihydrofolate synthase [Legionellales bacterium]
MINNPPKTDDLGLWLEWLETLHLKNIDLSLERIKQVATRLALNSLPCPVITVGGTNGKGSTVAALEAIYLRGGYRVGAYTSPHLLRFNERIRINGQQVSDQVLLSAFKQIEDHRGEVTLTFFEYTTLAGLLLFKQMDLDIVLLEVGLGGRLDAVNIIDSDVAIVTSIDFDHTEWLGDTREKIAFEKAGIFKHKKIAICGDFNPPASLLTVAASQECQLYCQGRDFYYEPDQNGKNGRWFFMNEHSSEAVFYLPTPQLAFQNISTALMAYHCLSKHFPVNPLEINLAISEVKVEGRFECIRENPTVIVDVAHNPAAARMLSEQIQIKLSSYNNILAVFSALTDKDIVNIVRAVSKQITKWYIAPVSTLRRCEPDDLYNQVQQGGDVNIHVFDTITEAYSQALLSCGERDCILVFGSFYTVAEVLKSKWRL